MTELVSILFFLIGLVGALLLKPLIIKVDIPYSNAITVILYLLLWNSEYLAASISLFAVFFMLKEEISAMNQEKLQLILSHYLYILLFSFLFRKLKDISMQYIIELNLQNIK